MSLFSSCVVFLLLQGVLLTQAQDCNNVEFVKDPQDVTVNLGEEVRLHCERDPPGLFTWQHYLLNGSVWNIANDEPHRFFDINETNGDLIITRVEEFHAGEYACRIRYISQGCVEDSNNATLNVNGRPRVTLRNQTYYVETVQKLNISGAVSGFPMPTSASLYNATSGEAITDERFSVRLMDGTLFITVQDVQVNDGGNYRITASNMFGNDSKNFLIETKGPDLPQITVQPSRVVSPPDQEVTVRCSVQPLATRQSNVNMIWRDPQGQQLYFSDTTATILTLRVTPATDSIDTYTCNANNSRGFTTGNTTIYGPFSAVTPQIRKRDGQFRVSWTSHAASATLTITYTITILQNNSDLQVNQLEVMNMNETVLPDLAPGSYGVRVVAGADGVMGRIGERRTFIVDPPTTPAPTSLGNDPTIAVAAGASAGVLVLLVIGGAIGIFFLCFYYPHRKKMQGHQRTFNKDEEDGGAVANSYTTLTLHPSVQLPPSPESVLVSSIFSAEIDPKWEFNRENIQLTEVLNEGQFTVLYKGVAKGIREKPIEVAVKSVKEDALEDDLKLLVAEMEQLSSLGQHPNIVSLVRVCTVGKPLYMVMEYMCHGDLLGFLRCSRGHQSMFTISPGIGNHPPCLRLSSRDLITVATKIANGMRYLADRKIVHRALCARNVLVGSGMDIKIYNVGAFDLTFDERELMKWMAIETLFDSTTTTYSDVWSFGVTLWELVTVGGNPYAEILPEDLYTQLHSGMRMPKPPHCSQEVYDIMSQCWERNPTDRPHFAVIHEKLDGLASSKMSFLDLRNYNGMHYSQFDDVPQLSTAL